MSAFPSFEDFYAAANGGRAPFPWQSRLAREVAEAGWPNAIGVPTGLGKTSCIDIAVWALASQAERPATARSLPTRVWYVVNRRLLVDAAYDHGEELARLLHSPGERGAGAAALRAVADALRAIGGFGGTSDRPLAVSRLRGGAELGARPPHPAQPTLVFATVPMFASTWLFRGYASSAGMRPVDAAHAGIDSLVLLDEAHLSRPLVSLRESLALCDVGDPSSVVPLARSRPVVVALTATGDAEDPFLLGPEDEAHPVVRQRLEAPKPVRLVEVAKRASAITAHLVEELAKELASAEQPVAAVLFANTAAGARDAFNRLMKLRSKGGSPLAGAELRLVTGRMRRREADAVRAELVDRDLGAPSSRDRSRPRMAHLVVVATQTLEVGADLDFDVLVTETCGVRALIQRLGRLNRLGATKWARGVVAHPAAESVWPVYGTEPGQVWLRLRAAADEAGIVQLPPLRAPTVLGDPDDRPDRVGELLPAHLWEWAKTTTPPPGEAAVELFFEGFGTEGPRVTVCWRATRFAPGQQLVPAVSMDESVDVPLHEAREVLSGRLESVCRLGKDRVTLEPVEPSGLRPGDVVVLNTGDGLYDRYGWNPEGDGEVADVSLSRWPGIPLDASTLRHWLQCSEALEDALALVKELGAEDTDPEEISAAILDSLRVVEPRASLGHEHAEDWRAAVEEAQAVVEWSGDLPVLARRRDRRRRQSILVAADAFDDLSADASQATLADHLESVGELARRLGEAVGLPASLVSAVEAAGRFHDIGKADPRFQRWLNPRREPTGPLLAKSAVSRLRWRADREASGWPAGGRHEALSGRMVRQWLKDGPPHDWDDELVTHLVLSHHGYGRPLVPPADDPAPTWCSWQADDKFLTVSGDLNIVDWDQPSRFRRCCERYGYWGLALLEAIVRQADHLASGRVEVA